MRRDPRTVRCIDVLLDATATLRVGLVPDPASTDALVLAMGHGRGRTWREDPAQGLVLPAGALPGLREALGDLERIHEVERAP